MSHGLSDSTVERIRNVLARHPEVDKAVLYGSRAKETHRPGSDIDLTLIETLTHPELLDHIRRVGIVFHEQIPAKR